MDYLPRVLDAELDELLGGLPAVAIEGPKGVGKTATAQRRAATVHRLDDRGALAIIEGDPSRLVSSPTPILIDEWQRFPSSWDLVRRSIDEDLTPGRFLLTGSATPTEHPTHTGAGRIPTIRMRPLSFAERGLSTATVSVEALLGGDRAAVAGATSVDLVAYTEEILRSGFPGIRASSGRAQRTQLDGYLDRIVERDFEDQGRPIRNPSALRRWMAAFAAASSTTASFETIRDAATGGHGEKPARSTTLPYRDVLEQLWILDDVPGWLGSRNHIRRLAQPPKHQLADPALAARLLQVDLDGLLSAHDGRPDVLRDGPLLGRLFESLVTLSIRVYAQANEAKVSHLRTKAGEHEIDLVIERRDGRVIGVEVKLSSAIGPADTKQLLWLRDQLGEDFLDGVVISTGPEAYRRDDGIAVVPLALLGP